MVVQVGLTGQAHGIGHFYAACLVIDAACCDLQCSCGTEFACLVAEVLGCLNVGGSTQYR